MASTAQEPVAGEVHPILTEKYFIGGGIFFPQEELKFSVDGTVPSEEIDIEESLSVDDSEATGSLTFLWRFGDKWQMGAQAWQTDQKGGAILTEDVEWNDLVFKEGSFARAGVELNVARLFFGRQFSTGSNHEFGLGVGLHWMEINAFIEGEIIVDDDSTDFQRESVSADLPLPNIGGWYTYSWAPRWAAQARLDWLDASVGDYSGGLTDASAGIFFQAWKSVGINLNYNYFRLHGDIDKSGWRGGIENTQSGPRLTLYGIW